MEIKFKHSVHYGILKKEGNLFIVSTKENPTTHDNIIARTQAIKNGIDVNEDGSINLKILFEEEIKPTCANYERDNYSEDSVVEEIREKFLDRSKKGQLKYGTSMDRNDLSIEDWLEHSIQEKMDDLLYMTKIKKDVYRNIKHIIQENSNDADLGKLIRKIYG